MFSPNAGKYGPEKIPYMDTFHAVLADQFFLIFLHEVRNKGGKVTEPDYGKRLTFQEGPRSLKNGPEMSFLKFSKILSIHMFFFYLNMKY